MQVSVKQVVEIKPTGLETLSFLRTTILNNSDYTSEEVVVDNNKNCVVLTLEYTTEV